MMLISQPYLDEQRRLHTLGGYGEHGGAWAPFVMYLKRVLQAKTVLDYGCGQGDLRRTLSWYYEDINEYDPAILGKNLLPQPADLVCCIDVMEHFEPSCMLDLFRHLNKLTKVALFAVVSTRPSGKRLSCGRNAHLIIKKAKWWRSEIDPYFSAKKVWYTAWDEWVVLLVPRDVATGQVRIRTDLWEL